MIPYMVLMPQPNIGDLLVLAVLVVLESILGLMTNMVLMMMTNMVLMMMVMTLFLVVGKTNSYIYIRTY